MLLFLMTMPMAVTNGTGIPPAASATNQFKIPNSKFIIHQGRGRGTAPLFDRRLVLLVVMTENFFKNKSRDIVELKKSVFLRQTLVDGRNMVAGVTRR